MPLIHNTQQACEGTGTTLSHAKAFHKVANQKDCVIISRAVGKWATGLIEEGYASKGYHVKSKSCDWGPMAGFICVDPRFTKLGNSTSARENQRKANIAATSHGAEETDIYISFKRFQWLLDNKAIKIINSSITKKHVLASSSDQSITMNFILERTIFVPGTSMSMYKVFYHPKETVLFGSLYANKSMLSGGSLLFPVKAFIDPLCPTALRKTFKAAMTGDYDLWAVFPKANSVDVFGIDKRPVEWSSRFTVASKGGGGSKSIKSFERLESAKNPHMGNITDRTIEIKDALNAEINHPGGMMVHHSDEAGRPLMTEVDLNVIAFIPNDSEAYQIKTYLDLNEFFKLVIKDYSITLNPGWGLDPKLLIGGFRATNQGNWEV